MKTSSLTLIALFLLILGVNASSSSNILNDIESNTISWQLQPTQIVSEGSSLQSRYVDLAADKFSKIHVVWQDNSELAGSGSDTDIFYRQYDPSNSMWSSIILVSSESTLSSTYPAIAVDSRNNLHIVWEDTTDLNGAGTDSDIFYKKFDSTTQTWGTTIVVSNSSTLFATDVDIVIDNLDNIHIIYRDYTDILGAGTDSDIFYTKYDNSTASWSSLAVISSESTLVSTEPKIAVGQDNSLHVVWSDSTDYGGAGTDSDIFYKKYNPGSDSWDSAFVVSTLSTLSVSRPAIGVDSIGNVHIAWEDITDVLSAGSSFDIFYRRYNAASFSWSSTSLVSIYSTTSTWVPSVTIDSLDNVHIVWYDATDYNGAGGDFDVWHKKYDASTSIWSGIQDISQNEGNSLYPSVAIDRSNILYFGWYDLTDYNGAGTDDDILFRQFSGLPDSPQLNSIEPELSNGVINLEWDDMSGVLTYNVYRSSTPIYKTDNLIAIASTDESHYVDILDSDGTYYYAITAVNVIGEGSVSNTEYVTVESGVAVVVITQNHTEISVKTKEGSLPHPILPTLLSFVVITAYRKRFRN